MNAGVGTYKDDSRVGIPGEGKTILLAEEMQGTGRLISCDAAENRVRLIRTAVERMGFANVEALCNDATRPNPKLPAADRILVDAPLQRPRHSGKKGRISVTKPCRKTATMNYWPPSRPFWTQRLRC